MLSSLNSVYLESAVALRLKNQIPKLAGKVCAGEKGKKKKCMSYALCSLNSHCGGALEWDIEPPSCCSSRGSTRLRLCLPECAAGSCYERAQSSLDFSSLIKFKKKKKKRHSDIITTLDDLVFCCFSVMS